MDITSSFALQQKDNMTLWKSRGKNTSLCDTKGCVPLEVQIKKYLLAGRKLEELRAQNTFEDYQEAYHDVPIVTEDMDIVEILEYEKNAQEFLKARANERALKEKDGEGDKNPTPPEPEKNDAPENGE